MRTDDIRAAVAGARAGASGYARVTCPRCEARKGSGDAHRSLSFKVASGWWNCWRCGTRGRLDGAEYAEVDDDAVGLEPGPDVELPEGCLVLYDEHRRGRSYACDPAWRYLTERGLHPDDVAEAGLGYCPTGPCAGRIVVPVVDAGGALVGWNARGVYPGMEPKYLHAPGMKRGVHLYNEAALYRAARGPVYVVEGTFDALALWPQAVACLGKPVAGHHALLRTAWRPVVWALDGDAWRECHAAALQLRAAGKQRVGWLKLPPGEDPGKLGRTLYDVEPSWLD